MPGPTSQLLRVLLLDDDADDSLLACRLLKEIGEVVCVQTREDFERELAQSVFNVVITDQQLRGYTGAEACVWLKAHYPGIPCVLLTNTIRDEEASQLMQAGFTDWVLKDRLSRLPTAVRNAHRMQRRQVQELRSQRMENVGALVHSIVHDINNILAIPTLALPMVRGQLDPRGQGLLDKAIHAVRDGNDLLNQVVTFVRGQNGQDEQKPVKPLSILAKSFEWIEFFKGIELVRKLPDTLPEIIGNATQIGQVLLNLYVNARDAMKGAGNLSVSADVISLPPALPAGVRWCRVCVTDDGCGIEPEVIPQIFQPFFTTKEFGTGRGLATVHEIMELHGGTVDVLSAVGRGTTFTLLFPIPDSDELDEQKGLEELEGSGQLVLIVDDSAAILEITRMALELHNYRVLAFTNGLEALACFKGEHHEIALLLVDSLMPEMDGPEFIRLAREIKPDVRVICMTGGIAPADETPLEAAKILRKPYSGEALLRLFREVLAS